MKKGRAVGILGGTFDPVHNAHIDLAKQALEELSLEKVIFMPAYIPPHKQHKYGTADYFHRYNMVKCAIGHCSQFDVSQLEYELQGNSYTARTLTILNEKYDDMVFIVGADSYMALDTWYHPEVIFSKARIACAVRDDVDLDALSAKSDYFMTKYNGKTDLLHMGRQDISSTMLREMILSGEDISDFVPLEVRNYIDGHGLYRS